MKKVQKPSDSENKNNRKLSLHNPFICMRAMIEVRALSKRLNRLDVFFPSPEDEYRSSC
jgi:hypothetical protein